MNILDQIKGRQQDEQQVVAEDQYSRDNEVDAGASAQQQRVGHRQQMEQVPDRELQEVEAGPEEQAMVSQMEKALLEMVHGADKSNQAVTAIMSAQDPVHGIGTLAADIVGVLKRQTPGATDDVLGAIGERAVEELTELLEMAQPEIDLSENDMAEAYAIGIESYMGANQGDFDEDELRGFMADA